MGQGDDEHPMGQKAHVPGGSAAMTLDWYLHQVRMRFISSAGGVRMPGVAQTTAEWAWLEAAFLESAERHLKAGSAQGGPLVVPLFAAEPRQQTPGDARLDNPTWRVVHGTDCAGAYCTCRRLERCDKLLVGALRYRQLLGSL